MYNKFLTTIYAADSLIDDSLFKIQSELRIELPDKKSINLCTFSKESDNIYTIYFRYIPGITVLDLINGSIKDISTTFIPEKLQLGKVIVDTDKIKDPVVESDVSGLIEVVGYLDAVSKETFDFAEDVLSYIVKSLQDLLKGKYVVTYKKPFDISKEVKQVNKKWKGTEYDSGIYKILEKIQSFCRMNFINSVKDRLIADDICTLIGFKKYESVINKEYSTVSDTYFESDEFKTKVNSYIYELNLHKDDTDFITNLENKLLQLTTITPNLDNYINSIKQTGNFGVNEYPLISFAFIPEVQNEVKAYINDFIDKVFTKREANLYKEFFSRIAITKKQIEELKNRQRSEKEFVKFKDFLSDEDIQSLQDIKTVQETQSEAASDTDKKVDIDKSLLSEQVSDNGESLSLEEAIRDFADHSGYTVEYKEGTNKPSKVLDEEGNSVNVTDFMNMIKNEYDIEDTKEESYVSTSIYDSYLKPESYSQFQNRASVILAQLMNINKNLLAYINDIESIESVKDINDIYNKVLKLIINAVELPKGIQKSLLSALYVSNRRIGLEQLQMVLDIQIQIIKIFVEDTDYKSARGRVNAVLNEYRDLSKYFNKQVESFNISQDISKVVKETKDRPYLLAKKFRMYLNKLGWRYNARREVFYKGKLSDILDKNGKVNQEKLNSINDELRKLLDEFNKINNTDLKFEDIFTQRSLILEPIDIVVRDNTITKTLFNNIDEILTNAGIKDLNSKLDAISFEINNL